ncbi:MAG: class I SAM-dependent rRNA methyltransferase [Bdellovibrionota bacterium]
MAAERQRECRVTLRQGRERSLKWRHPWVFSGGIERMKPEPDDGDIVAVHAADGSFLGRGYYSAGGSIAVKMLSFNDCPIDQTFWSDRIAGARRLRERLGLVSSTETTGFRLVHAEGDSLPGLIIDLYGRTAVLQCQTTGIQRAREEIVQALLEVWGDRLHAIYDKSTSFKNGEDEEVSAAASYLMGELQEPTFFENGYRFAANWETGQKTGFFLDQRENRKLVERYAKDRTVLNAFCYTGGFSVYALGGGAKSVISVDSAQNAIEGLEQNISLNGMSDRHTAVKADFLRYMQSLTTELDLIILDPPAFAKQKKALVSGLKGYRSINREALRAIRPGGILFTFSCSQLVTEDDFRTVLFEAALEAKRSVRILHRLHQAPCHPISLFHPEGNYLKGFVVEVEDR